MKYSLNETSRQQSKAKKVDSKTIFLKFQSITPCIKSQVTLSDVLNYKTSANTFDITNSILMGLEVL